MQLTTEQSKNYFKCSPCLIVPVSSAWWVVKDPEVDHLTKYQFHSSLYLSSLSFQLIMVVYGLKVLNKNVQIYTIHTF